MDSKKKKIFPKVSKKFQNFLTDESGKITKQGALGISAAAALLASVDNVDATAYHYNTSVDTSHGSSTSAHSSGTNSRSGLHSSGGGTHSNIDYGNFYDMIIDYDPGSGCSVNHASGIVNGHANVNPSATWSPTAINSITGHGSHVSHANHGSGGWC